MKARSLLRLGLAALGAATVLTAGPTYTAEQIAAESAKANAFFDRVFDEFVARSPEFMTTLGMKRDYDKWDDASEPRQLENLARALTNLAELKRTINYEALDAQTQVSHRLFTRQVERQIEAFRWRFHNYPVNPQFGAHSQIPSFLMNFHRVTSVDDARAYITRVRTLGEAKMRYVIEGLERRTALGIIPPKFVFPLVLDTSRNIISGEPFDSSGRKSALLEDFEKKVGALKDIDDTAKAALIADFNAALLEGVKPAYEKLITTLEAQEKLADDRDGAWKFPLGREYYDFALRGMTTTNLSADEIHELGLREVARIHGEMEQIKAKVGFAGTLQDFFKFMREDPQFYYPNTPEGKAAYLRRSTEIIDTMRLRLDELFGIKPKAAMVVKAVEPFREKESGGAFYPRGAPDGSRPGTYYVNLYDMAAAPKYEMEALAYHEGIPGHHMQLSIAQELQNVPKFRRMGFGNTAYTEGWGLYTELVPKEIGFYQDPYSDFGRLSMELWRAARLVVDTGLHAKKWTRTQTMAWLRQNTPNSDRDILTETNRYIVNPGQATAYKIGMIRILELRERAKQKLGAAFDIRAFHDVVLGSGAVPLDVLEENVDAWIAQRKG